MTRWLGGLLVPLLLAGCGGTGSLTATEAPTGDVSSDARLEVRCDGKIYEHGKGYYDDGLATVQDSPTSAVENWLGESWPSWVLPADGYEVAVDGGVRVLVVHDARKVALVVSDDVTDWDGDSGWGVTSWAACDPAEFEPATSDALGVQVWENAWGDRMPIDTISSYRGAEHCDWQHLTFLEAGGVDYVNGTADGFGPMLRSTYAADAVMPQDATDTGFRRDGRELWVTEDAAYMVSATGTERWPAFRDGIGCD